jgi:hypothetical protein
MARREVNRKARLAGSLGVLLLLEAGARAQPVPPPAPPTAAQDDQDAEAKRKQARAFFEKGVKLHDEKRWDEALAEFLRSRRISPTRAATKYAANCLKELRRFEEALDLFEDLLTFPNLSATDRQFAEEGIAEVSARVGTLAIQGGEPGASVVIDGRYRGTLPLPGPVRLTAGSHEVRAFKEGLETFGATVEVKGRTAAVVTLRNLSTGGRLQVSEQHGRVLEVVVDGAPVGKTPWEGPLSVGTHLVTLRGSIDLDAIPECAPGDEISAAKRAAKRGSVELGTQPVSVPIRLRETTPLTLMAEALDTSLRVEPMPGGALVSIDSVVVGHGAWEGRLRVGDHEVEVSAEGFLPETRKVSLTRQKRHVVTVALERDRSTPGFRTARSASIGTLVVGALGLGVGAVTGALALVRNHEANAGCVGGHCFPSQQADETAARTLATVSTPAFVMGGLGVAAGTVVLLALGPGGSARRPQGASLPSVESAGLRVGLGRLDVEGRF